MMVANGPAKLRDYGQLSRPALRRLHNIVWVHGGDFNPPDKDLVRAIADGIREADPHALHTAHCAPETAAIDYWRGEPWLQSTTSIPTSRSTRRRSVNMRAQTRMPFFLMESAYENEHRADRVARAHPGLSRAPVRGGRAGLRQQPDLAFRRPRPLSRADSWQQALDSRGAQSMTHARRSVRRRSPGGRWSPTAKACLSSAGQASGQERLVAAYTHDRRIAVVYLPAKHRKSSSTFSISPARVVTAHWYDPASGQLHELRVHRLPRQDLQSLLDRKVGNSAGLETGSCP